jgi:hypothetical protein
VGVGLLEGFAFFVGDAVGVFGTVGVEVDVGILVGIAVRVGENFGVEVGVSLCRNGIVGVISMVWFRVQAFKKKVASMNNPRIE